MGFVIAIHILVCIFLIVLILIQSGRGGGLIDNLSSMESVLGTKTNAFLTKTTSIMAILFFLTCLSLAFFSLKQSRSLMRGVKPATNDSQKTTPAVPSAAAKATAATEASQNSTPPVKEAAPPLTQEAAPAAKLPPENTNEDMLAPRPLGGGQENPQPAQK